MILETARQFLMESNVIEHRKPNSVGILSARPNSVMAERQWMTEFGRDLFCATKFGHGGATVDDRIWSSKSVLTEFG